MPALIASAYGLIYPSFFGGFGLPVLEAMQSGVPVISSDAGALPEIANEVALFCDPENPEEIGKKMSQLFIDESLRDALISRGFERAANFNWNVSAEKVWETLMKTIS